MRTQPATGDFVVEYLDPSPEHDQAHVVIVHLTGDTGPHEVFWSRHALAGLHAERLATTWALEDGTCAWRLLQADSVETAPVRIAPDTSGAYASLGVERPSLEGVAAGLQRIS